MTPLRPSARRLVAIRLTAGALALAALAPVAAAVPATQVTGGAATIETPAETRLREAREGLEETSARLAQARTAAQSTGGAERAALRRVEARLRAEKDGLIRREERLARRAAAEAEIDRRAAELALQADDAAVRAAAQAAITTPLFVPPPAAVVPGAAPAPVADAGSQAGMIALIDGYLASRQSPLTGLGATFVAESAAVGLDPRFLVAIAGAETGFGTYGPSQPIHNPFGMGPGIVYPSWAHAIGSAARNLAGGFYVGEGRYTIPAIQQRWAPNGASNDPTGLNSHWTRNVSTYYAQLGGDPLAPVFVLARPAAAA